MKNIVVISSQGVAYQMGNGFILTMTIVTSVIIIGLYLLRSFALFKMAKNQGEKALVLCFIPLLWVYKASKISATASFFGRKIKHFPIILVIIFSVANIISFVHIAIVYFPLLQYYFNGGQIYYNMSELKEFEGMTQYWTANGLFVGNDMVYPFLDVVEVIKILNVVAYFSRILSIISDIALIILYFAFFKARSPQHTFAYSIFSIFGLFPIFAFAVRNKPYIDYEEFMRNRFRTIYGDPNARRDFTGNYGQNNNQYNNSDNSNPFSDFNKNADDNDNKDFYENGTEKGEDPFGEFSDKNDKDRY